MDIGARLRELRDFRRLGPSDMPASRAALYKFEHCQVLPSLAMAEKLAEKLQVSLNALFGSQERFDRVFLEDDFVLEVMLSLKSLNTEQRTYLLKVLAAAPKQVIHRPRSANTGQATSSASAKSTGGRVSTTFFQISPTRSLPLAVSRKTVRPSALHS